jgi:hypothetical protein
MESIILKHYANDLKLDPARPAKTTSHLAADSGCTESSLGWTAASLATRYGRRMGPTDLITTGHEWCLESAVAADD